MKAKKMSDDRSFFKNDRDLKNLVRHSLIENQKHIPQALFFLMIYLKNINNFIK